MSEGRALLTERERDALAGEETDNYRYKTRTYFRARLERLEEDVAHLAEHEPELLEELRSVVCESDAGGGVPRDRRDSEPERPAPDREPAAAATPEPPTSEPATLEPDDGLAAVVEEVAEGWEDTEERLAARKAAARAVLEYAREHGSISKQQAKEEVYPEYPVEGQNARTWYRKNIRPVLNEAAEYDQSRRAYRLALDR